MSLIIVSNRVPSGEQQPGGLVSALTGALRSRGGTWVGWSGNCGAARNPRIAEGPRFALRTFDLTEDEYQGYYVHHSNDVLWPLFHMRPDLLRFDGEASRVYERVNAAFCEQVLQVAKPDDSVWVHDYHLIPLARHLRAGGFTGRIGFFLHVPFPAREVAQALPGHQALFLSMVDYDHIGFQTEDDVARFRAYADAELSSSPDAVGCLVQHSFAHPVSIATRQIATLARRAGHDDAVRKLRDSVPRTQLIIGVDRLDYSKGLLQRLKGFQNYLSRADAATGMTLLQIATPTRSDVPAYARLHEELDQLVGTINGQYASASHTPVRYVNQTYTAEHLAGFYRAAHIGLVTPLRDGMNLVAKEYVAAQDEIDPGVLVLSCFAGAANELDGAILVNPHDTEAMAHALVTAHAMRLGERRERWRSMMNHLLTHDVDAWAAGFLDALEVPETQLRKIA